MKPSRWFVVLGMLGLIVDLSVGAAPRGRDSPQPTQTPSSSPTPQPGVREAEFSIGDVFVAIGDGKVQWRRSDGALIRTLETGRRGETTGMAFDNRANLYVTGFSEGWVCKFDPHGNPIGTFGSGYDSLPESIIFDRGGNAYVGQAGGGGKILKFNSAGTLLGTFKVAITSGRGGSDWLELAADQCTLYYTSEGKGIKRFDVCTDTQRPDFVSDEPRIFKAFAFRLLPSGGALLAAGTTILRFDATGKIVSSYGIGQHDFFALNLDPDGKSFWSAEGEDMNIGDVYKFDIETGRVLLKFNAGPVQAVGGLTVFGEIAVSTNTTQVTQEPGKIRVTMESAILFDFNRYDLKPEAETALAGIKASLIDKHPRAKLIIEGHTDDVGSADYNLNLSKKRAQSVADWMNRHGIEASRIQTNGYGKSRPKVPNTSDANRARNRRVEIVVIG